VVDTLISPFLTAPLTPDTMKKSIPYTSLLGLAVILLCTIAGSQRAQAQDPQFTQFYANPLYLNPAFAGSNNCPRAVLNYRNQWPSLSGVFVTYSASYDQHVRDLAGGLGLLVTQDDAANGTLKTTMVSGMYAYHLPVTRTFSIRAGFQASYFQKTLDWNKLSFGDQIDSRYGFIYNTAEQPQGGNASNIDVSAGLLGYTKQFYVGAAVHHLTTPNESVIGRESPLPMKFTGHVGAVIPLGNARYSDVPTISPNLLYQQQENFQQLNMGVYVTKGPLVGGLWYRNKDSFIVLVGLQTKVFKVGYSYDVTVSKLSNASGGSHEISMQFLFPCKAPPKRFRTIDCPSF